MLVGGLALAGAAPPPEVLSRPQSPDARAPASETAFLLTERDLIPEGIALDPRTWTLYLGSFRKAKILAVSLDGRPSTFVPEGADGLQAVLGLRVDQARDRLWACTSTAPQLAPGRAAPPPGVTGLMAWDLGTGKSVFRWLRPKTETLDAFNDLTIAGDGTVYVSGFAAGTIYRLKPDATEPETWMTLDKQDAPNGIDLSEDGKRLYVSTGKRLVVIDVASGRVQELAVPKRAFTSGIDGLAVRGPTLIAIQRNKGVMQGWRIARFRLAADGLSATAVETLAENDRRWSQPTTGVVVGRWFYYIGNSQFPAFGRGNDLPPVDELKDVRILRLALADRLRPPPPPAP
ncbi:MAG TPA: SMP-30/gluconolactonase/LRE family protein [Candidatus Polarisedimenticolaceae bacterium]|nr:SMP-30/gluconolactonase/LRE family protein [Candidatus Polarisedimenticolaceae bacterium]